MDVFAGETNKSPRLAERSDRRDTVVTVVDSVRDLGVIIDSQLCMDAHVSALCRGGYYQLRQLRPIIRSLSTEAADTLVHAFVSSRLDYCNALLFGVANGLYLRLQSIQNAAARLVSGLRYDTIR